VPSLDRLEVLESLLRTKSPTASARELGVTQSAVSKTLAVLRAELADPLLLRRGDTMVLTPRAERLRAPLSSSLNALRGMLADTAEPSGPATATLALRDQFVVSLGPAVLRIVAKESPRTVVRFLAYERERVAEDLARGAIDVAVAVDPPESPGLRQSVLYRETFVCIAPQREPLTLSAYLGAGHLSTTAHAGYSGVDQVLSERGHSRRIVASTSFFATAAHLADELGLVATLPSRVARAVRLRRSYVHPVPFAVPPFPSRLIWDARAEVDPANRWVRDVVRRAANEVGTPIKRRSGRGSSPWPRPRQSRG
jgi:DNA-binding transcriptional LysR family regulator